MVNKLKRYISLVILMIMVQVIFPPAYLHDLMGHEDTRCIPRSGTNLEKHHHHCELLKFESPAFISQTGMKPSAPAEQLFTRCYFHTFLAKRCQVSLPGLRAPPAFIS